MFFADNLSIYICFSIFIVIVSLSKTMPFRSMNFDSSPLSDSSFGVPMAMFSLVMSHTVSAICRASSKSWVDRKIVLSASRLRRFSSCSA